MASSSVVGGAAGTIADGTISTQDVGTDTEPRWTSRTGSVSSAEVADGSLAAADLGANSVGSSELDLDLVNVPATTAATFGTVDPGSCSPWARSVVAIGATTGSITVAAQAHLAGWHAEGGMSNGADTAAVRVCNDTAQQPSGAGGLPVHGAPGQAPHARGAGHSSGRPRAHMGSRAPRASVDWLA